MGTRTTGRRMTGRLGQKDLVGRVVPAPHCDDIVAPLTNTETWVECRVCHRVWQDALAPGVSHHYVVCDRCRS